MFTIEDLLFTSRCMIVLNGITSDWYWQMDGCVVGNFAALFMWRKCLSTLSDWLHGICFLSFFSTPKSPQLSFSEIVIFLCVSLLWNVLKNLLERLTQFIVNGLIFVFIVDLYQVSTDLLTTALCNPPSLLFSMRYNIAACPYHFEGRGALWNR